MKISVIGTGAYGLAIALSLAKNGNEIMMWTENPNKELEFNFSLFSRKEEMMRKKKNYACC